MPAGVIQIKPALIVVAVVEKQAFDCSRYCWDYV